MLRRFSSWIFFIFLTCLAIQSCGGDANILITIETIQGENPFDGVEVLRIAVERTSAGDLIYEATMPTDAMTFELPAIAVDSVVRVIIEGFADQDLSELRSSGVSRWLHANEGDTVEESICFCKKETVSMGMCDCSGKLE